MVAGARPGGNVNRCTPHLSVRELALLLRVTTALIDSVGRTVANGSRIYLIGSWLIIVIGIDLLLISLALASRKLVVDV